MSFFKFESLIKLLLLLSVQVLIFDILTVSIYEITSICFITITYIVIQYKLVEYFSGIGRPWQPILVCTETRVITVTVVSSVL